MKDHAGLEGSPIWLLADSNPVDWEDDLEEPLDRRFPTRHIIWTPILEVVQRHLFPSRLNDGNIYIRNAVEDLGDKSNGRWRSRIDGLRSLLTEHRPPFLFCFGQFAFESARQAQQEERLHDFRWWKVERLSEQFSDRISKVRLDPANAVNVVPLLHAVVARKFQHCHQKFSGGEGNYYEYVGRRIAEVLHKHRDHPRLRSLWAEPRSGLRSGES